MSPAVMKLLLAAMAAVVVAFSAFFVALERPGWLPEALAATDEARVLVFLVGEPAGVERVRRAVDPLRVVYATDDALALVEGRIVATDLAAVTRTINDAGWHDRSLEIFHVERAEPFGRRAEAGSAQEVDRHRLARLRALVQKPTLSYGEQLFVLEAMNDGIEF